MTNGKSLLQKNMTPASVFGERPRGPSSTPFDEEGFISGVYGRQREWRPDLLKNVSEQFEPVNRR
jgi:hypothetical protein